ncbi:MAG TPA: GNAT family N-acetyltransferase [Anaerolineae bacterium]|nr:GNAT family N-acetyltransferase [Anaerolineae bacterium]HNU05212.1 GNAT family N-acetyltransferase [Anaerolineae bacterium]
MMSDGLELRIRPATAADERMIKATIKRAGLDRTGLNWRNFQVAEDKAGVMAGLCQVRRYRGVRELGSLYVRPDLRGRGLGGALINVCLAAEQPPVHLECIEDRQSFYEAHDFQRIPLWEAPPALRIKSMIGTTGAWLLYRKRVIVMVWLG